MKKRLVGSILVSVKTQLLCLWPKGDSARFLWTFAVSLKHSELYFKLCKPHVCYLLLCERGLASFFFNFDDRIFRICSRGLDRSSCGVYGCSAGSTSEMPHSLDLMFWAIKGWIEGAFLCPWVAAKILKGNSWKSGSKSAFTKAWSGEGVRRQIWWIRLYKWYPYIEMLQMF